MDELALKTNEALEQELHQYLLPGENLIWTDKPKQGISFDWYDLYVIPFSLLWGGSAFFGFIAALFKLRLGLALALMPLVAVGCFFIVGRFYLGARIRKNTIYGLTKDCIIIKSEVFSAGILKIKIKSLSGLTLQSGKNGAGSIGLGPEYVRHKHWLILTENVQQVYNEIKRLR